MLFVRHYIEIDNLKEMKKEKERKEIHYYNISRSSMSSTCTQLNVQ